MCYDQFGLFKFNNLIECTERGALYSGCTDYTSFMMRDTGGSLKPAQAMGAIAAAFGGIIWVGCTFMLFFRFPKWLFKTIGGLYIFCFATQMLTLLTLNHDICTGDAADALKLQDPGYQCNLGSDGVTSIMAGIFYLGIGITVLVCPVPKTQVLTCFKCDCCEDDGDEGCGCCSEEATQGAVVETSRTGGGGSGGNNNNNTTVTETYNDDGTVTVKEERTNPDGSITVSVTTKPNPSTSAAV